MNWWWTDRLVSSQSSQQSTAIDQFIVFTVRTVLEHSQKHKLRTRKLRTRGDDYD